MILILLGKMRGEWRYLSWLERIFQKFPPARNIAEFGIRTNEKAQTGTTLLKLEKILGNIHIAIGDTSTVFGKTLTPFHIDFLFKKSYDGYSFSGGKTLQTFKDGNGLW